MEQQLAEILARIIEAINDGTVLLFAVPFIVIVVNLLKRIVPAEWASGSTLHFVVQVVVWVGYVVFGKLGGDLSQFETWIVALTKIMETLGPILFPALAALFAGHTVYHAAKNRAFPVLGYQRPPGGETLPKWLASVRKATAEPKG